MALANYDSWSIDEKGRTATIFTPCTACATLPTGQPLCAACSRNRAAINWFKQCFEASVATCAKHSGHRRYSGILSEEMFDGQGESPEAYAAALETFRRNIPSCSEELLCMTRWVKELLAQWEKYRHVLESMPCFLDLESTIQALISLDDTIDEKSSIAQ